MPYTPASPEQTMATVSPPAARSSAMRHRSISLRMGVVRTVLSGYRGATKSV